MPPALRLFGEICALRKVEGYVDGALLPGFGLVTLSPLVHICRTNQSEGGSPVQAFFGQPLIHRFPQRPSSTRA